MEVRGFHFFAGLLIALTGLIVYSNTLHTSFQFDDHSVIVDKPAIKDLGNIPQYFQRNDFSLQSRGVITTTFAINYYFSGLSVEGYRWVNTFVHLINGRIDSDILCRQNTSEPGIQKSLTYFF